MSSLVDARDDGIESVVVADNGDESSSPFTSPENDYRVEFPAGEPELQKLSVPAPGGGTRPMDMYLSDLGNRAYGVARLDLQRTPDDVMGCLECARDSVVRGFNGKLIDSRPIELQGRLGIEYSVQLPNGGGIYIARNYVDETVFYQVIVAGVGETDATDPDVQSFLNSFTFERPSTSS